MVWVRRNAPYESRSRAIAPQDFATTVSDSLARDNVYLAAHATPNGFVGLPGFNFANGGGAVVAYMNRHPNVDRSVCQHNVTPLGDGGATLNGGASANRFGISAFQVRTAVRDSVLTGNQATAGRSPRSPTAGHPRVRRRRRPLGPRSP